MPAKGTSPRERWNPLLKSYPDSEKVNAVSIGAETMFTRLIAKADDYGNYWATPRRLLAGLYSCRWEKRDVDETCMVRWRDELVTCTCGPLIALYSVSGVDYLHLINPRRRFRADVDPEELVPREPSNIEEKALSEHVTRTYRRRTADVPLDLDLDLDLDSDLDLEEPSSDKPRVNMSKEDLSTLTEHYATIRGARPRGNAWLPIQQGMKAMVVDEAYTVAQITGCMDRLVEWGVTWQINTVRRWIADYAAGKMPSKNGGATSGNDPRQQMKSYAQHDPSIYEHRLQGFKEGAEVYETSFAASDERRRAKREAMNKEENDED